MKFTADRPFADAEKNARKILEIARPVESVQDRRIQIKKINEPFLYKERATLVECGAGMKRTIDRGWLWMHESVTNLKPCAPVAA
jgi:hypothetical protein